MSGVTSPVSWPLGFVPTYTQWDAAFAVIPAAVATIAALRAALTTTLGQTQCYVLGYTTTADGGEGIFVASPTDTTSSDNGVTIIVDASARRWYRNLGGQPIGVKAAGALGNGTTSDAPAFTAAMTAAGAGAVVMAQGGNYDIGSALTGTTALLSMGASYVNPANLPGVVDATVYGVTPWVLQQSMALAGTTTTASANQFLASFQAISQSTSALAPCEKAIVYTAGTQLDVSNAPTIYRDLVGYESHMGVGGTNGQGRIWGYHTTATVPTGTDGFTIGVEAESVNHGVSPAGSGALTSPYQKTGFQATADGPNNSTFAFNVIANGGMWEYGLMVQPGAIPSGGFGVVLPAGIPIGFWNTADTAVLNMIYTNSSAQLILGTNASSVVSAQQLLPTADNTLGLGGSGDRWTAVWAVNGTIQTSDASQKEAVQPLPAALPIVHDIDPVTYEWKKKDGRTHWGFLAGDVETAMAKTGRDFGGYIRDENGGEHMIMTQLIPVLWQAVRELSAEVTALKAKASS